MTTKDTAPYRPLKALDMREAGKTLREIGNYFSVSDERARQLVAEGRKLAEDRNGSRPLP